MKKLASCLCLSLLLMGCQSTAAPQKNQEIILATTTSTKDSGLLDEILPVFEEKSGYHVNVISVGSGEAMKMGENGALYPMLGAWIGHIVFAMIAIWMLYRSFRL